MQTSDGPCDHPIGPLLRLSRLVALFLSGCSFVFNSAPAKTPAAVEPDCQTSRVAPVLDATVALSGAVLAIAAASDVDGCGSDNEGPRCSGNFFLLGVGGLTAIVWGIASAHGFISSSACRNAHASHANYLRHHAPQNPTERR